MRTATAMTHDQALDLALRWAAVGVPAFPIKLKWDDRKEGINKEPLKGTSGFRDATTDADLLRRRFNGATLPSGWCWGVGLHLGPAGIMALDVDVKNGARGDEELAALEEEHGKLPDTPTVITASGGSHVWLAKGERQVDNTDLVHGHIEVRADAGFVVAPGVFSPWGSWDFDDASGDVLEGAPVAAAPEWIFTTIGSGAASSSNGERKVWSAWRHLDESVLHPADLAALVALRRLGGHGENIGAYSQNGKAYETLQITSPHKTAGTSATIGFVSPGIVRVFTSNWWLIDKDGPHLRKVNYDADHLADLADAVDTGDRELVERLTDPLYWAQMEEQQDPGAGDPAPDDSVEEIRVADVTREQVRWLWPGRLAYGKVAILDGDPGLGKSTFTIDVGARASNGNPMPDGTGGGTPTNVLILSAEDGAGDTIRPRLEAAGADLDRVWLLDRVRDFDEANDEYYERPVEFPKDLPRVEAIIRKHDIQYVVVDPLVAFLGSKIDSHRDQDIRRVLYPLAQIAGGTGAAVLCLRHLNKAPGTNVLYRGGASIGIIGAARTGMLIARHPEDPNRRVLAITKCNLAPEADSLVFTLQADPMLGVACIAWQEGASVLRASDLLGGGHKDQDAPARDDAEDFLRYLLADGPLPATEVWSGAKANGVAPATLNRAKKALGVRSYREGIPGKQGGGAWFWALDDHPISTTNTDHVKEDGQAAADLDLRESAADQHFHPDGPWERLNGLGDHLNRGCPACGGPLLTDTATLCWDCQMEAV